MGEKESRIPVLLIQRPGFCNFQYPSFSPSSTVQEGYACGWDIIIPSGWAMAFWIALVYRGARVGGLREAHSISLQAQQLNQIKDVPDSSAGKLEIVTEGESMQQKHNRRPPAKRPNYTKLGFDLPFSLHFTRLCQEWNATLSSLVNKFSHSFVISDSPLYNNIYVLRHRRLLQLLNHALMDVMNFKQSSSSDLKGHKKQKDFGSNPLSKLLMDERGQKLVDNFRAALVPVCVNVLYRGVPVSHARICQPSKDDLKLLSKDRHYGGPMEMLHPDPDAPKRKKERKERLRLRRKRKQGKKVQGKDATSTTTGSKMPSISTVTQTESLTDENKIKNGSGDQNEENLNEGDIQLSSFINHTSRPVIGFVTKGDFDLGQGQGSGIGFCSVAALLHIIAEQGKQKHCVVLVRNPTSFQYRFASVALVL